MPLRLTCRANCDDVFLAWGLVDNNNILNLHDCLGFRVEYRETAAGPIEVLTNLKGFEADQPRVGQTKATSNWPLQTFTWTHHAILHNAVVQQIDGADVRKIQYRVTPMIGQPGALYADEANASGWVGVALSAQAGADTEVFFNRGFILSQFVSRYAQEKNLTTMADLKRNLTNNVNGELMQFLSGELGKAVRGLVASAAQDEKIDLYCALFELDLSDLVDGLSQCGGRAHVLLANGSVKTVGDDENARSAQQLEGKVDLHRRMTAPNGLAHNKFVVVCKDGKPFGVLTGSTNWTMTGLHTQLNNAITIKNSSLAQAYLDHWHTLAEAGDEFPQALRDADSEARGPYALGAGGSASAWFAPTRKSAANPDGGPDIQVLKDLVANAQQGILFVMFMPGQEPLDTILGRQRDGLFVRGVVSTLPMGTKDKPSATFQLLNGDDLRTYSMDVVEPQGANAVGSFVSTFSRQQFLNKDGMGYAITHSKVIVIDPFGAHPVVVTGSHNFSISASSKNDENFLILRDCPEIARAYAVNCMSVYNHYRWPAYQHDLQRSPGSVHDDGYLATTDAWQQAALSGQKLQELKFWL